MQNAGYIVTEDFIYPHDKHGKEYGWGWALLTTPEARFGKDACKPQRSPEESYNILMDHFHNILPQASDRQLEEILK